MIPSPYLDFPTSSGDQKHGHASGSALDRFELANGIIALGNGNGNGNGNER